MNMDYTNIETLESQILHHQTKFGFHSDFVFMNETIMSLSEELKTKDQEIKKLEEKLKATEEVLGERILEEIKIRYSKNIIEQKLKAAEEVFSEISIEERWVPDVKKKTIKLWNEEGSRYNYEVICICGMPINDCCCSDLSQR